jgi:hypothetical protein
MSAAATPDRPALKPHQRHWSDLRFKRILLGLLLAPMLPSVLSAPLAWAVLLEGFPLPLQSATSYLASWGLAAEAWALLSGLTVLLTVVRRLGYRGRNGCLILGCAGAFTLPFFGLTLGVTISQDAVTATDTIKILAFGATIGLPAMPFGLLGGWIFWRVAVRPAPASIGDVTGLFD